MYVCMHCTLHKGLSYTRGLWNDGIEVKELAQDAHRKERAKEGRPVGLELRTSGILSVQGMHLLKTLYKTNKQTNFCWSVLNIQTGTYIQYALQYTWPSHLLKNL